MRTAALERGGQRKSNDGGTAHADPDPHRRGFREDQGPESHDENPKTNPAHSEGLRGLSRTRWVGQKVDRFYARDCLFGVGVVPGQHLSRL